MRQVHSITLPPRRTKATSAAVVDVVLPEGDDRLPLHRKLYEALREAILSRRLPPGAKLPSTRGLASQMGLSRNTVVAAFDQLLAEGYVTGRAGSGTDVATALPERLLHAHRPRTPTNVDAAAPPPISRRGQALLATPSPLRDVPSAAHAGLAFQVGLPAIDAFPVALWSKLLWRQWARRPLDVLCHHDFQGHRPLREAIAGYLSTSRGVRCHAGQIVIVSGSQQAINLVAQTLLDPGEQAWVEDPGYGAARSALIAAGVAPVPVPVDDDGLSVADGRREHPNAKLAIVTPSHQMPLGVTMPLPRRLELLRWAQERGGWILEDDYDGEFRYAGRPLAALQGLDTADRVIYCGTFSKVLAPSLRLGYLVVPERLVDAFVAAKITADMCCPPLEQTVVASFMAEGHFVRHVRRMRVLYVKRQATLIKAAEAQLARRMELRPAQAGMHLVGWLPQGADDRDIAARALAAGVRVAPLSSFRIKAETRPALILGYACAPEREIPAAVQKLRTVLR
jgi:GntR family transcriptional regulator/MocR family aminotransferase